MILSLTYPEITSLIKGKTGHDLSMSYRSSDTLHVEATVKIKVPLLGDIPRRVGADIRLIGINGSIVAASIDAGSMMNLLLDSFKSKILDKAPQGLVRSLEGGRMELDLEKVVKLRPFLDNMILNNLVFSREGLYLDASMRTGKNATAMI